MKIITRLISINIILTGLFTGSCKKNEPTPSAPISSITVSTLSGSGVAGYAEGTASLAKFNRPEGLAVATNGVVYVADSWNNVIRKIDANGTTTLSAGSVTPGFADGVSTTAKFIRPTDVAVDASGNVYVADTDNHRIRKIDTNGSITTVAGDGTDGFKDGPTATARFSYPSSLEVDASGNIYVADGRTRIRKISTTGEVSTLAGSGTSGFADGAGSNALFNGLYSITMDDANNIYATEIENAKIRKITPDGMVSTLYSGTSFTRVALDKDGNFLLTVYGRSQNAYTGSQIIKVSSSGTNSAVFVGSSIGYADGSGTTAKFQLPAGIAVGKNGVVYVADWQDNRIRKIVTQ